MKILFVLGYSNPRPSAAWERIKTFAEVWALKGHNVEILGTFDITNFKKSGIDSYRSITLLNFIPWVARMRIRRIPLALFINLFSSFFITSIVLFLKRPDIVVISVPTGDIGIGSMISCVFSKRSFVIDFRDEWEDYGLRATASKSMRSVYSILKRFTTLLYSKSLLIAAVTEGVCSALRNRGLQRIEVVPNGANINLFKPRSKFKPFKKFRVIYVGQVGKYYRVDIVVKAIKKLVDDGLYNVELIIAGWGDIENLFEITSNLEVSNKVRYLGTINDKEKLSYEIAESSVGVIPYDDNPLWKNALPAKFFEYCACGIPIVASVTRDSLLTRLIDEYQIGLCVPPLDVSSFAKALLQIYDSPDFALDAGTKARRLIETHFDREKIARRFLDLIRDSMV
ncbi:MAG: glycosyltransferase family 4 protein [Candidatus Aminicenantes bacterium]|nr:glycosyltransferase family 4 protein [Candidatus Aminicenantes bacterium]